MFKLLILLLAFHVQNCRAEGFGLGLGWPYAGVKCETSDKFSLEGRWVMGGGVKVYAGRAYWNFYTGDKIRLFAGPEGGYIKFDARGLKGEGYEGAVFAGGEYFLSRWVSAAVDFVPARIGLEAGSLKARDIGVSMNTGLYFYFGGRQKKIRERAPVPPSADIMVPVGYAEETGEVAESSSSQHQAYPDVLVRHIADLDGKSEAPVSSSPPVSVAEGNHLSWAREFSIAGDYVKAEAEYKQALEADPDNFYINGEFAEVLFKQDKFSEAENVYLDIMNSLTPQDTELISVQDRLGMIYVKQEQFKKAGGYFSGAIKAAKRLSVIDGSVINSYIRLAQCLEKAGNIKWAVKNYEKALELTKSEKNKAQIRQSLTILKERNPM